MTQTCHFGMAGVKELDRVLSGKVISGTGGSFHRNLDQIINVEYWSYLAPDPTFMG